MALVDTGCSRCVAHVSSCNTWKKEDVKILAMNGQEYQCEGTGTVCLKVATGASVNVNVFVVGSKPLGYSFIVGMNGIMALGRVTVNSRREVQFGVETASACAAATRELVIDEHDFIAKYDSSTNSWTAAWKWAGGAEPGVLSNMVDAYAVPSEAKASYEAELHKWIQDKWLIPYDEKTYGPVKGLIPLMAVIQRSKGKVRPVMDFRELNHYIETFTAEADVCSDKLREWRKQGTNVSILDLKKAYLQIRIHESLWPYQTMIVNGQRYCLTRLGFGLNVAPLIMKAVLNSVLSQDADVKRGTSAYIDDVLVNEDVVTATRVAEHLQRYGLTTKEPEHIPSGARVLGLRVWGEHEKLFWARDGALCDLPDKLTRRSVFSVCGKLVGHFPVCGWLRVAMAYVKRRANLATQGWDDVVRDNEIKAILEEIIREVKRNDPVHGRWDVTGEEAKVWVDASSLALGVIVEVSGCIVEDASWLRADGASHINMAELDAVVKGLNLALAWRMRKVELITDSSTVHRWLSDGLSGKSRMKTKAASEMLIRRRIGIVLSLVEEYKLRLNVTLVQSWENSGCPDTRTTEVAQSIGDWTNSSSACVCCHGRAHERAACYRHSPLPRASWCEANPLFCQESPPGNLKKTSS